MGGGLLQLVAYGAQDVYLTGNPQITFFKVVYRRHTNFSIESIRQSFSGNFDFGNRVTSQISRNGDLVSKMILEVDLPKLQEIPTNYINYICYHLNQNGWHFEDYDTIISNAVNEKYSEKESNNDIINNIPSFSFKTVNINNDVNNNDINNNGINDSKDKNCIVCMCEIEENEECKKLKCGHMFHSACIDNWLKRTLECPMCRNVIT